MSATACDTGEYAINPGPALLLLTSDESGSGQSADLVHQLGRRFRVLTPGLHDQAVGRELFDDARDAIEQSGAHGVVVAAVGHAGWTAIALRQKLGRRIRGIVLLEWQLLVESWPLREGSPLAALSRLEPPVPVLHLYAQPRTPDFLVVQQGFARSHRWFNIELLETGNQQPVLQRPHAVAHAINRFAAANQVD